MLAKSFTKLPELIVFCVLICLSCSIWKRNTLLCLKINLGMFANAAPRSKASLVIFFKLLLNSKNVSLLGMGRELMDMFAVVGSKMAKLFEIRELMFRKNSAASL